MRRWLDPLIVAAISVVAWLVGRPWAGFNSPDSEFYASLALFGSDVADRSMEAAYTWTRLGYIAPVRGLTHLMGDQAGFGVWRLLLIATITGSVYAVVRLVSTRQLASIVAALSALNTVVLSFAGNSYVTGSIIAALCLLLALGCWQALGAPRHSWLPALAAGGVAGWLMMLNPYGLLLGMSMWIGVRVVTTIIWPESRWRSLARDLVLGVTGFVVVFGSLLLAGLAIFPGRSWLGTYLEWNSRLDYSSFIGDASAWQRDIALLVPVAALLLAVTATAVGRNRLAGITATVIAALNICFTAIYLAAVPGPWLEAPTYVGKLWAGSLIAAGLAFAGMVGDRDLGVAAWLGGGAVALLAVWSGHWDRDLSELAGWLIVLGILALGCAAGWSMRRGEGRSGWLIAVAALAAFYLGSQLLQNGRGFVGTYGQFPFRAAYVDFEGDLLMSSKIAAERWVLAHTEPTDRIGIWTDQNRAMASVAAMQLWGWYNNVSSGEVLAPSEAEAMKVSRPTALAMYAPERAQVEAFYASLPKWSLPTPLECTTVPFRGVGNNEPSICITHLRWG